MSDPGVTGQSHTHKKLSENPNVRKIPPLTPHYMETYCKRSRLFLNEVIFTLNINGLPTFVQMDLSRCPSIKWRVNALFYVSIIRKSLSIKLLKNRSTGTCSINNRKIKTTVVDNYLLLHRKCTTNNPNLLYYISYVSRIRSRTVYRKLGSHN